MTITTVAGPQITYGITLTSSGADLEHNPDRGPSFADLGEALVDPRPPFMFAPGQASSKPFYGWAGLFGGPVVDQAPSAISSNVIAATQVPVGGTALTLNSVTSNGFGPATTINAYEGGTVSIRPIDGAMTGLAFGVSGGANIWNPQTAVARTLQITGSALGTSAESWSIAGRDIYGQKMTELIQGASITVNGKKAWKYISAIVPSTVNGAIGSTLVIVGTNDVFGFPLRVDHPAYVTAWAGPASSATLITVSSASIHTFAVTSGASNTTGDVRGTLGSTSVGSNSNSSNWKIVMLISPSAQNLQGVSLGSSYPSGIVGLQQFSSV
jgi:hypothetical protein